MKILISLLFFITIACSCSNDKNTKIDKSIEKNTNQSEDKKEINEIGFACGEGGEETKIVKEFYDLIKEKKHQKIKSDLFSFQSERILLSTFTCEQLNKEGLIKLNNKELNQIKKNHFIKDTIFTCSGCTDFGKFTIKEILSDTSNYMRKEAEWWIDDILGKKIVE